MPGATAERERKAVGVVVLCGVYVQERRMRRTASKVWGTAGLRFERWCWDFEGGSSEPRESAELFRILGAMLVQPLAFVFAMIDYWLPPHCGRGLWVFSVLFAPFRPYMIPLASIATGTQVIGSVVVTPWPAWRRLL